MDSLQIAFLSTLPQPDNEANSSVSTMASISFPALLVTEQSGRLSEAGWSSYETS